MNKDNEMKIMDKLLYICENTCELDEVNKLAQELYQEVPHLYYNLIDEKSKLKDKLKRLEK